MLPETREQEAVVQKTSRELIKKIVKVKKNTKDTHGYKEA